MTERTAVQAPLVQYATQIGWDEVRPDDALALRGGESGRIFRPALETQLLRLNPGVIDPERAAQVVRQLDLLPATIEGNRDALAWLRGERSVFVPAENRERNVRLIDFAESDNNVFQVTAEWTQKGAVYRNRADVVFLINGIPVAVAETKAAHKPTGLEEGIDQVRRYHRETPDLFVAAQLFEVTQLLDFWYGPTWATSRKDLARWKDELPEHPDYERMVTAFFDRERILRVLRDYVVFLSKDDVLSKVLLRQHQIEAVEKVVARVHDPAKRRGLVWHTQGSGKTLTMITIASRLLRETRGGEKPTVLMLVDRNELEQQLFKNIAAYGIGAVEVAQSKQDLRRILGGDYRGLIVSMIHKFDDVPANLNTREAVTVLVDEAHRTTGGDLGNYLMAALPNATYIGFTGTPVDNLSQGKGTFKVFGVDDPEGYLDKYSIAESVEDGTTVRLNYALAPSDLRVDRETLEREFLSLADAEGVADVDELNAILDRAVELKDMMKSESRVERIAAFVAEHFRQNVEPMGFKAFLVAVDREACALYKQALDRHLPPAWSEVVYSPGHSDKELLKAHHHDDATEKQIRRDFTRKDALPKILIVTEKLLTGFDTPILYCMYLDKPMRDHVLLQAIARVNRPYEDDDGLVKPFGFVLDFVGIFEKLERALAFDSDVVASVIKNIDVLKALFATLMTGQAVPYRDLARGWDDKAKERAVAALADKTERQAFYDLFKQLQSLYEILSPDADLRPYIEDFQALAALYGLLRTAYDSQYVDRNLTEKTRRLLREQTATYSVELPGEVHELGPKELAAIKSGNASDVVKVLNLKKLIASTVEKDGLAKPFLRPIGERAEALAQQYEERQVATQQALDEFAELAEEILQAEDERQRLGLDPNAYAIHLELAHLCPEAGLDAAQANLVNDLFARYPDYLWNERRRTELRTAIYKTLRPLLGTSKTIEAANAILGLQRV
jgi:type I restriction enzyme, R subunit